MFEYKDYVESANYIKNRIRDRYPRIAIILGSGLGTLCEEIEDKIVIRYNEIPNFPISTVEGHTGELIIGKLGNKEIMAMNRKISLL